ncbi:MAG: DoxX family protein [Acidobacteria bacterium]|nr:DoxX family protein [Acidobacteriota bacterium]
MDEALGATRIFIGAMILMTGIMKITVPMLRAAWSGQLRLARLPFYKLTFWLLPVVELAVGTLLILGVATRPAAAVVLLMMLGAIYVHIVVDDPSVFPLQPNAPIIPIVVTGLTIYVLVAGTGAWSVG